MVSRLDATHAGTTPEPASAMLRRLHDAAAYREDASAARAAVLALPALADFVEAVEKVVAPDYPAQYGDTCHLPLNDALAALRERLGAKP